MKIRFGEVGKTLRIYVQDDGAVKDLTGYSAVLRVKNSSGNRIQADRTGTVTAATGLVSYSTVAGDWSTLTFDKAGSYIGQVKLTKSTTNIYYTHTFPIDVVDYFAD